jgi:Family of unknown function (DUF6496)
MDENTILSIYSIAGIHRSCFKAQELRRMLESSAIEQSWLNRLREFATPRVSPSYINLPSNYTYFCWDLSGISFVRQCLEMFRKEDMMAKYGKKAQRSVKRAMQKRKKGILKSGKSGKRVTSRKQAIAIGLSEARRKGAKVPSK